MHTTKTLTPALVALVALAAACDHSPTATQDDSLTADDVAQVAIDQDLIAGSVIFEQIGLFGGGALSTASAEDTRTFDRTRDCPAGGTVEIQGTVERTANGEGTVEFNLNGTKTRTDCVHERPDVHITTNGQATFEAYRKRVNGQPAGNQTLHTAGHFAWVRERLSTGQTRSGECDFDLSSVRNPDAMKITITGTVCGRDVDRTIDWKQGT